MSVVPAKLAQVGQALTDRPEIPFVAATTGSTHLVAALLCENDRSLYQYITDEMSALDGITHMETAPVMRAVKCTPQWLRLNDERVVNRPWNAQAVARRIQPPEAQWQPLVKDRLILPRTWGCRIVGDKNGDGGMEFLESVRHNRERSVVVGPGAAEKSSCRK
jgi:hypothetical protein